MRIPSVRLDTPGLLKEHVNLLKIDTQGHELKVLQGCSCLLLVFIVLNLFIYTNS